jgi:hypothetical protein
VHARAAGGCRPPPLRGRWPRSGRRGIASTPAIVGAPKGLERGGSPPQSASRTAPPNRGSEDLSGGRSVTRSAKAGAKARSSADGIGAKAAASPRPLRPGLVSPRPAPRRRARPDRPAVGSGSGGGLVWRANGSDRVRQRQSRDPAPAPRGVRRSPKASETIRERTDRGEGGGRGDQAGNVSKRTPQETSRAERPRPPV